MTIDRVNPPSWAIGDKLTSAQINQLDLNTTYALDKRAGQTDTLASTITLTGSIAGGTITGPTITGATITGGSVGAASGIATLNGSSKVPTAQVANATYGFEFVTLAATFSTTSTSFVDTGLTVSISAQAGDVLLIDIHAFIASSAGTGYCRARSVVTDGGVDKTIALATTNVPFGTSAAPTVASLGAYWVVGTTGTITVRVQSASSAATTCDVLGATWPVAIGFTGTIASNIRVVKVRP